MTKLAISAALVLGVVAAITPIVTFGGVQAGDAAVGVSDADQWAPTDGSIETCVAQSV